MRRLAGLVLTLALLAAGCGGDDKDKRDNAAGGDDSTTTSTTAAGDTTTTSAGGPTATSAPGPNATGTGKGATAPAQPGTSGGTGGQAATSRNLKPAAPGRYTYNRTGKASTSAFGERSLDGPVSLQVDPATAQDQRSVQSGPEGSTEQIIRLLPEGAYFTFLKQTNQGLSKEFRPEPAVLAVPDAATVGRTWSWTITSSDGATTLNASLKVERNETLNVGGESVPTIVLAVVLKTSGDIESTTNQTSWVALGKGLVVKTDQRSDGRFGSVTFNSQSSMALASTKPA